MTTIAVPATAMHTAPYGTPLWDSAPPLGSLPIATAVPVSETTPVVTMTTTTNGIPTTTAVVPMSIHNDYHATTNNNDDDAVTNLTIERRHKDIGRENPWNIYYQGRLVTRLHNGDDFSFYGLGVGQQIQLELRDTLYTVTIQDIPHNNNNAHYLHLRLKHKVGDSTGG